MGRVHKYRFDRAYRPRTESKRRRKFRPMVVDWPAAAAKWNVVSEFLKDEFTSP